MPNEDPDIAALRESLKARETERTELIELGRVNDFLQALDEPPISADDAVPSLFLLTFARTRRPQPAKGGGVKLSDTHEFFAPVRVGDVITSTSKISNLEARQGKRGKNFSYSIETTFRNQRGEVVGTGRFQTLRLG